MNLTFDFCSLDGAAEVQAFIRDHWRADHVLARDSRLMDWQFRDDLAGRYNFLLARDADAGVVGMLGFIPASRYDPGLAATDETVWLTNWKVRSDLAPGAGLVLLRMLSQRLRPRWIGTVGLNPATRGIYQALGYRVGLLARRYLLNPAMSVYRLATVPAGFRFPAPTGATALVPLSAADFWSATEGLGLDSGDQVPRKSRAVFERRYLRHPFYEYRLFLAVDGAAAAIVALRACGHDGAVALRVVDILGAAAALTGTGAAFARLLPEFGAEYLDFYCSGLDDELAAAGFGIVTAEDGLILPGHFEPYERSNIDLLYCLSGKGGRVVICKGDADQDRPNRTPP